MKHTVNMPDLRPYKHTLTRGARSEVLPGVNITMLAGKAKMNRAHLSAILNGRCKPGYGVLVRLSEALGLDGADNAMRWVDRVVAKSTKSSE